MFRINLDSSVFISHFTGDVHSEDVTKAILELKKLNASIYISLIVYSEIWTGIELIDDPREKEKSVLGFYNVLNSLGVEIVSDNVQIAKRASKAQANYKKAGGKREVLIPDFLIGANAEFVSGILLTTNPRDFMKYFPELNVLTPEKLLKNLKNL